MQLLELGFYSVAVNGNTEALWCCVLIVVETESETNKAAVPMIGFAPSKWETVDESELESQGDECVYVMIIKQITAR